LKIALSNASGARVESLRWVVFAAFAITLLWSCRAFFDFGELFLELRSKSFLERGSIGASEWQCFLSRSGRIEKQQIFSRVHREFAVATHGGVESTKVIFSDNVVAIVSPRTRFPSRNLEPIMVVRDEHDLPSEILSKGSAELVRSEKEFSSDIEDGWLWTVELARQLPPDAKVFFNEPSLMLYYFSTFMWYPRRVDVETQMHMIRDAETFEAVFRNDPARLDANNLESLGQKVRLLGYTHLVIRKDGEPKLLSLRPREESNQQ
jgi:hypothetical protein